MRTYDEGEQDKEKYTIIKHFDEVKTTTIIDK